MNAPSMPLLNLITRSRQSLSGPWYGLAQHNRHKSVKITTVCPERHHLPPHTALYTAFDSVRASLNAVGSRISAFLLKSWIDLNVPPEFFNTLDGAG
jgi:hypothetical protein